MSCPPAKRFREAKWLSPSTLGEHESGHSNTLRWSKVLIPSYGLTKKPHLQPQVLVRGAIFGRFEGPFSGPESGLDFGPPK